MHPGKYTATPVGPHAHTSLIEVNVLCFSLQKCRHKQGMARSETAQILLARLPNFPCPPLGHRARCTILHARHIVEIVLVCCLCFHMLICEPQVLVRWCLMVTDTNPHDDILPCEPISAHRVTLSAAVFY